MAKSRKRKAASGDVATNRQAAYRYHLIERFEAGIALTGTEVKSLREGSAQLKDAYAVIRDGEVWLIGLYIAPYGPASRENHDPERPRKLLLHRYEIERLIGRIRERGLTLVPTRIYFSGPRSRAKVEIALARGKDFYDKRESIRKREWRATCNASCARRGGRTRESRAVAVVARPRRLAVVSSTNLRHFGDGSGRAGVDPAMTIGTSIVLIALGAILKWAVTAHVNGFNIQTAGTVLFVVGLVGLVLSLIYTFWWARRDAYARGAYDERVVRRPPPAA